jgi:hypothetical protein
MKKKTKKVVKKPDFCRIIALSAAGHYIAERLNEELALIKLPKK